MFLTGKKLFAWQRECLERWNENGGRGIVNVVTGGGKTLLALGAIDRLRTPKLKVKIVVPKIFLVRQWASELRLELGIPSEQIGCYYGSHKDPVNRPYMIYVVNSARYSLSRHILAELKNGFDLLLIADECHHYGSTENIRIFDFIPCLPQYRSRFFSLGLSATPDTAGGISLAPYLGKEIYRFGFVAALESDIISDFLIFRVGVDFEEEELAEYEACTESLGISLLKLKRQVPKLKKAKGSLFFALLQKLTSDPNQEIAGLSRTALTIAYRRRDTIYRAKARIACAVELIARLDENARIIVFGERIETADLLYQRLLEQHPGQVGRYHSELPPQVKKDTLDRYQTGQIRILISCRALDEGLNIPETDVGIILSESTTVRQRIQRLGRILRRSSEEHISSLYLLYIRQTSEGIELSEEFIDFDTVELEYDSRRNDFNHPKYDELCRNVLTALSRKGIKRELILEIRKNLRSGAVRGDYLLSKEHCRENIRAAVSKQERNYWITMLYAIQAATGELPAEALPQTPPKGHVPLESHH